MDIGSIYQFSVAAAAMLLCVASMMTSRRHRTKHRRLMVVAFVLIGLSVVGLVTGVLVDAADEFIYDPMRAMLPSATLLLCLLPVWRALQAKRIREASTRDRRSTSRHSISRPQELGSHTSRL